MSNPYGYCPHCGKPGVKRARDTKGTTWCAAGHSWEPRPPEYVSPALQIERLQARVAELEALLRRLVPPPNQCACYGRLGLIASSDGATYGTAPERHHHDCVFGEVEHALAAREVKP